MDNWSENVHLDNLPENIQKAIYYVFNELNVWDKVIFLSRMEHGSNITYREIAEMMGTTFQFSQQQYDTCIKKIVHLIEASGAFLSGVIL